MAAILIGAFGSLIGSFLNVVVYRVPLGRSLVSPPSACTDCGHSIRGVDNIPMISWLALRGRCRNCRAPISMRYPLVELGTALLFTVVAARFLPAVLAGNGATDVVGAVTTLIAFLYFASISLALALIDIDTRTLPNRIVVPAYAVGAVLLTISSALTGNWSGLWGAALGATALFAVYLLLALLKPGGMGFGDVKLAGVIGLFLGWLGWQELVVGAFAAFLFGGIFSVVLLLARRTGRRDSIPFGPWMLAGAWVGALAGEPLVSNYLGLFGIH
jgi:leader peptidase (prepilin peptidase)/N-methyltransferase